MKYMDIHLKTSLKSISHAKEVFYLCTEYLALNFSLDLISGSRSRLDNSYTLNRTEWYISWDQRDVDSFMEFSELRNDGISTLFTCSRAQLRQHKWGLWLGFQNGLLNLFLRTQLCTRIGQKNKFETCGNLIKVHGELGCLEVLEVLSRLLTRYHVYEALQTPDEAKKQLLLLHDIIWCIVNVYKSGQITFSLTFLKIMMIQTNTCSIENKELMNIGYFDGFYFLELLVPC